MARLDPQNAKTRARGKYRTSCLKITHDFRTCQEQRILLSTVACAVMDLTPSMLQRSPRVYPVPSAPRYVVPRGRSQDAEEIEGAGFEVSSTLLGNRMKTQGSGEYRGSAPPHRRQTRSSVIRSHSRLHSVHTFIGSQTPRRFL